MMAVFDRKARYNYFDVSVVECGFPVAVSVLVLVLVFVRFVRERGRLTGTRLGGRGLGFPGSGSCLGGHCCSITVLN